MNAPNPDLWPKAVARISALEFRRAPLLTAVCWFAVGEVISRNRQPAVVLLIAILLLSLLVLAALRFSLRTAIVSVAGIWIAVGCWCAEIQPAPPTQHALATFADGLSRQLRGHVVRVRELSPQQSDSDHDKETGWWPDKEADEEAGAMGALSLDIQVDSIEEVTPDISRMVPMTGGVRLNVVADKVPASGIVRTATEPATSPALRCGDVVEAPVRIKLAERYRDPGAWQYADYLLAQGIGAHAGVRVSKITLLDERGARFFGTRRSRCTVAVLDLRRTELGFNEGDRLCPLQGKSRTSRNHAPQPERRGDVERDAVWRSCRIEQVTTRRI